MRFVTKFWLCIGAVIAGYSVTVAIDAYLAVANERRMSVATGAYFPATVRLQEARHAFDAQMKGYEDGVVDGDQGAFANAAARGAEVSVLLAEVSGLPGLADPVRDATRSLRARHLAFTGTAAAAYSAMADPAAGGQTQTATDLRTEALEIRGTLSAQRDAMADALRQSLDTAARDMRHQRTTSLSVYLVIVSVSLAVVIVVMVGWSRRLGALLTASDRLAKGDAETVLPQGRNDELGLLTASFAAMRDAVQARAQELRRFNEGLEETVRARTGELAVKNDELALLEAAINQVAEAVIVCTPGSTLEEARILHANPAFTRITGWEEAVSRGRSLSVLCGPATDAAAFARMLAQASAGGEGVGEIICRRNDGVDYPGDWHICPINTDEFGILSLVAIHRDVTDRRRAQAELEEAIRKAGMAEIATGVLHNVGNVLNGVNVSACLLRDRLANPRSAGVGRTARLMQEVAEIPDFLRADPRGRQLPGYLAKLSEAIAQEQAEMIAELRSLTTAVDHIKVVIARQQAYAASGSLLESDSLADICEDALRLQSSALERDRIVIRREFAALPSIPLDHHKILQIVVNLVANARQAIVAAAPAERLLTVGAGPAGEGRVGIWVADNGVGIDAANRDRIFSLGFTTKAKGHGFGLHHCATSASEMGGRLTVASDGPGRGARFDLILPTTREAT